MSIEDLLLENKRLNAEIDRDIVSSTFDKEGRIRLYEHTAPLVGLQNKVEREIAVRRRMLTVLVKHMLVEVEALFRADRMTAASSLLLIARNLARLIYEEDDFKRDEIVSELARYQQNRRADSESRDFLAELISTLG
jgi:hypothetical protein